MWSLILLHLITMIFCPLHYGWWWLRVPVQAGIGAAAVAWLPPAVVKALAYPSYVLAVFYVLIQALIIVDMAHSLAGRATRYMRLKVFVALILYIFVFISLAFTCVILPKPTWSSVVSLTLAWTFTLLVSGLSVWKRVQERNPRSGLVLSGFMAAYVAIQTVTAIVSEGNIPKASDIVDVPVQQTDSKDDPEGAVMLAVAFRWASGLFTILSVAYTALTTSTVVTLPSWWVKGRSAAALEDPQNYSKALYHLVMVLASAYMLMSISGWDTNLATETNIGMFALVRHSLTWLIMAMYVWTLVAPVIFPHRDFGHGV